MKFSRRKLFALFAGASIVKAAPVTTLTAARFTFPDHAVVPLRVDQPCLLITEEISLEEFRQRYIVPAVEADVRRTEEWLAREWEQDRKFVEGTTWT